MTYRENREKYIGKYVSERKYENDSKKDNSYVRRFESIRK